MVCTPSTNWNEFFICILFHPLLLQSILFGWNFYCFPCRGVCNDQKGQVDTVNHLLLLLLLLLFCLQFYDSLKVPLFVLIPPEISKRSFVY